MKSDSFIGLALGALLVYLIYQWYSSPAAGTTQTVDSNATQADDLHSYPDQLLHSNVKMDIDNWKEGAMLL